MEQKQVIILKSEIDAQIEEIEKIYLKIDVRKAKTEEFSHEALSLWLHNLYCAFEDLFEIVARVFENNIMEKDRYHIELLKRMTLSIPGVRPALLSKSSARLLDTLRAFRHRLRHAYVYDIDPVKVNEIIKEAKSLQKIYRKDIKKFLSQLR